MSARLRKRRSTIPRSRRGGALIELAICLPLLVFLIGATIETCDLIFLRNSLTAAAYSGTLEASQVDATEASVRSQIQQSLTASGVSGSTITIQGENGTAFDSAVRGDFTRISIAATVAGNLRMSGFLPSPKNTITVNAKAVK